MSENIIRETSSGTAYEVILKAPSTSPRSTTPLRERPISQEIIQKKLKDAEERRLSMELIKLKPIAIDEARRQECVQKMTEIEKAFIIETEKKLQEKLELVEENKAKKIREIQERLKEHEKHIQEVREKKQEVPEIAES